MGISFGQVLVAFIVIIFLIGKYPRILKDFHLGIQHVRQLLTNSDTSEDKKEQGSSKENKPKDTN